MRENFGTLKSLAKKYLPSVLIGGILLLMMSQGLASAVGSPMSVQAHDSSSTHTQTVVLHRSAGVSSSVTGGSSNRLDTQPAKQAIPPACQEPTQQGPLGEATVTPSSTVGLPGEVVPVVETGQASYVGALPSDYQLSLEVTFKLQHVSQFDQCLASMTDPSSPGYRHFLTLASLEPFLPTPAQVGRATSYFASEGLRVADGPSPLVLELSAPAATVETALGVSLNVYGLPAGHQFYSPSAAPTLPASLAAYIDGITGLDNYSLAVPDESPCSGPYCPQGVEVGYGLSSLYSSGYNGAGQTVAVVDVPGDPSPQTAINTFSTQYSLPSVTLTEDCYSTSLISCSSLTSSDYNAGWASETDMDIEAVHSVAPGAGITLLYCTVDPMDCDDYAATNGLAPIISNSWSYDCVSGSTVYHCDDTQLPSSTVSSVDTRLEADTALGATILFASGDQGATPDGSTYGPEFPASDPNVLAVGATNLVLTGCGVTTCSGYGSESGASISGGGYSGYFPEPSWQSAAFAASGRAVPDVSMLGYDPGFWVYSTWSSECGTLATPIAGWYGCAGTSLATPLWAGFLAVVEQMNGGEPFGNIDPTIWQIADSSLYGTAFHDITTGNNGYAAGPGWDPVTGWGTPQANVLAYDLLVNPSWIVSVPGQYWDDTVYSYSCPGDLTGCSVPASASTSWSQMIFAISHTLSAYTQTVAITITDCCYEGDFYSLWETSNPTGLYGWTLVGTTDQVDTGPELAAPTYDPYWTGTGTAYSSTTFNVPVSGTELFAVRDDLFDQMVSLLGPSCGGDAVVTAGCSAPGISASPYWSPAGYLIAFGAAGSSGEIGPGGNTSWPAVEFTDGSSLTVGVTGGTPGQTGTMTAEDLFYNQPSNTTVPQVHAPNYYDVRITGLTNGTAEICVTNSSLGPYTVLQYWTGSQWKNASNQSYSSSGPTVCGDIAVSALSGTPLVIGTLPPPKFAVTVTESGIPLKTLLKDGWMAELNGTVMHGYQATLTFPTMPNGTYTFLTSAPKGYRDIVDDPDGCGVGTCNVSGTTAIKVVFEKGSTVVLTFAEKGLPKGQSWCVSVDGYEQCPTTTSVAYSNLTPGSYNYVVVSPTGPGWSVTAKVGKSTVPLAGTLAVFKAVKMSLTFAYPYTVTFTESGLTSGTWSVTIQGHTETAAWDGSIQFSLTNGTYGYRISPIGGYTSAGSPKKATVNGAGTSVAVTFTKKK